LPATVNPVTEKAVGKWSKSLTGPGISSDLSSYASPVTNDRPTEEDEPESSSEEESVEIISPPHRPITRSVSAKRAAVEEDDDVSPSLPRPTKVRRGIGKSGIFLDHSDYGWPIADLVIESQTKIPLFMRSSPEPIEVASTSNTESANASSHLDKGYFLVENPWTHPMIYF